ncbi:MAG: hypothetical protein P0Y56_16670 [Candidatus Andeanibacterium colombiense]|uniref:Uncharacterized protein n=1 Tax=Candidatus Andeanibacterium colombiense TaxID=3121345 RepID=A0AAJ5X6A8_9SPHN|nr:MAG: hypothetical protein P0Y56_16670 [Sphingomonadaceae bacterium]
MLRQTIVIGLMLALLVGRATAASPEDAALEPTTQWRIDYGEERCSLLRQFGEVKDGVLLEIASFGSRTNFRFTLIGKPVPK